MVEEGASAADKLRAEKEAKLQAIAEKKAKIEELRKKKAEQQNARSNPVDALLTSVLYTPSNEGAEPPAGNIPRPLAWKNRSLKQAVAVTMIDIPPPAADATEKECQTEFETLEPPEAQKLFKNWTPEGEQISSETHDKKRQRPMRMGTAAVGLIEEAHHDDAAVDVEEKQIEELMPEEIEKIMKDKEFIKFVDKAAKVIDDILKDAKWDYTVDYASDSLLGNPLDDSEEQLVRLDEYEESLPGQGRPITDCCFSPTQENIFVVSYAQKDDSPIEETDGELLVWNMEIKSKAETSFICDSAILTAAFDRSDPNLIWGGTYCGSVCLWDKRATVRPVQRTLWAHSHPVYAIQQVGAATSSTLVSVSTDGKVCSWSLPDLGSPQKSIELKRGGFALAATSMHFADQTKPDLCYVGCEDGTISQVSLSGEGVKVYEGDIGVVQTYQPRHDGPVMSVHSRRDGVVGDLFLSTSVDWTVRLWSAKTPAYPILQIEAWEDMVYDAVWHPQQPAVFAAVDGDGNVDLWNLSTSTDGPLARCESSRQTALNRCSWSPTGKHILVGDSDGTVGLFSVGRNIQQPPRADDFMNFEAQVKELVRVAGLPPDEIAHDDDEPDNTSQGHRGSIDVRGSITGDADAEKDQPADGKAAEFQKRLSEEKFGKKSTEDKSPDKPAEEKPVQAKPAEEKPVQAKPAEGAAS